MLRIGTRSQDVNCTCYFCRRRRPHEGTGEVPLADMKRSAPQLVLFTSAPVPAHGEPTTRSDVPAIKIFHTGSEKPGYLTCPIWAWKVAERMCVSFRFKLHVDGTAKTMRGDGHSAIPHRRGESVTMGSGSWVWIHRFMKRTDRPML